MKTYSLNKWIEMLSTYETFFCAKNKDIKWRTITYTISNTFNVLLLPQKVWGLKDFYFENLITYFENVNKKCVIKILKNDTNKEFDIVEGKHYKVDYFDENGFYEHLVFSLDFDKVKSLFEYTIKLLDIHINKKEVEELKTILLDTMSFLLNITFDLYQQKGYVSSFSLVVKEGSNKYDIANGIPISYHLQMYKQTLSLWSKETNINNYLNNIFRLNDLNKADLNNAFDYVKVICEYLKNNKEVLELLKNKYNLNDNNFEVVFFSMLLNKPLTNQKQDLISLLKEDFNNFLITTKGNVDIFTTFRKFDYTYYLANLEVVELIKQYLYTLDINKSSINHTYLHKLVFEEYENLFSNIKCKEYLIREEILN